MEASAAHTARPTKEAVALCKKARASECAACAPNPHTLPVRARAPPSCPAWHHGATACAHTHSSPSPQSARPHPPPPSLPHPPWSQRGAGACSHAMSAAHSPPTPTCASHHSRRHAARCGAKRAASRRASPDERLRGARQWPRVRLSSRALRPQRRGTSCAPYCSAPTCRPAPVSPSHAARARPQERPGARALRAPAPHAAAACSASVHTHLAPPATAPTPPDTAH
mmetsp:Transcript_65385/g.95788  ORF Transcript_65385/g.95788 Transcript_65385/m.95788 type:complete len:226 (+) Transcript_65385:540-1217(+)